MHLFVYGTLLSIIPSSMAKFLRRRATLVGPATVAGALYDLGMYPGFQTVDGGEVHGELHELDATKEEETLAMLDAYEGVTGEPEDEYIRTEISCRLENGRVVTAQTYISRSIPATAKQIESGNYQQFYAGNTEHQRFVNGGE